MKIFPRPPLLSNCFIPFIKLICLKSLPTIKVFETVPSGLIFNISEEDFKSSLTSKPIPSFGPITALAFAGFDGEPPLNKTEAKLYPEPNPALSLFISTFTTDPPERVAVDAAADPSPRIVTVGVELYPAPFDSSSIPKI